MTHRCLYCMKELQPGQSVCENCHKSQDYAQQSHHLPPFTILFQYLQIGAVLFEDDWMITYAARDIRNQEICWIVEYFPKAFASRNAAQSLEVKEKPGQQRPFARVGQNFTEILYHLQHCPSLENTLQPFLLFSQNHTAYGVCRPLAQACSLEDYIAWQGAMPAKQAVDWLRPVLKDVYVLHKNRILHTTISPKTLLVSNSQVYLSGFGLLADAALAKAAKGYSLLQPGFMASEQAREQGLVSGYTDVYAMAAIFYYVLSGCIPADGPHAASYISLHTANPALEPSVCAVIDQALRPSLEQRYLKVESLLTALLSALENTQPAAPQQPEAAEQPKESEPAAKESSPEQTQAAPKEVPVPPAAPHTATVHKLNKKEKARRSRIATIGCGAVLIAGGILLSVLAPGFDDSAKYAAQTSAGYFQNGLLDTGALEDLQAVDVSTLTFDHVDFASLDPALLSENPIITRLRISAPENLTSLAFLKNFPGLKTLILSSCQISDEMLAQAGIENMHDLEAINLNGNQITSLEFAQNLTSLRVLKAANNQITDMSPLAGLPQLEKVDLAGNKITVFVPLHTQKQVAVALENNEISQMEVYEQNTDVFTTYYSLLSLYNNPIFGSDPAMYAAISSLKGNTLMVSYSYSEDHLAYDGTEMAVYYLTYDDFARTVLVDADDTAKTWVESYFAGKEWQAIDQSEAKEEIKSAMNA